MEPASRCAVLGPAGACVAFGLCPRGPATLPTGLGAFSVLGFSASGPQCPPGTGHEPLSWCVSASWRTYFCSFRSCAHQCLSLFSTKRSFVPVSDNLFPCAPWVPGFLVEVLNTVHVYVEFVVPAHVAHSRCLTNLQCLFRCYCSHVWLRQVREDLVGTRTPCRGSGYCAVVLLTRWCRWCSVRPSLRYYYCYYYYYDVDSICRRPDSSETLFMGDPSCWYPDSLEFRLAGKDENI